jgi:hypothetical protein
MISRVISSLKIQSARRITSVPILYTPEETKLVRKLDWHVMPIVFAMYFMNKLDQNAIANARLDGFEKDLGLVGNQFNVCVSVLYAGYTLIQVRLLL